MQNTRRIGKPRKLRIALVGVAAVLLVGGGLAAYSATTNPPAPPPTKTATTEKVPTAIRAKGSIVPVRQTKLAFDAAGKVQSLAVKPGDAVKVGQVLATLDTREASLEVTSAEDARALAEVALEQAKLAASPEEVAAAEAAVAASEAHLQEVSRGSSQSDVLAAESALATARDQLAQAEAAAAADEKVARSNLDSARSKLTKLQAGPTAEEVRAAEIAVEQAKSSLWATQIDRDGTCGNTAAPKYICESANARVSAAEQAVAAAQNSLAQVQAGPSKDAIAAAQAAVDQAQATLDTKLATRDQNLASAHTAVTAAESRVALVKSGTTDSELKAAQSGVARDRAALAAKSGDGAGLDLKAAQIRLTQAEHALAQANLAFDNTRIVAPYDGVVAAVYIAEHDSVTPGAQAIVLADPSSLRVESTDLDQSVVSKLAVGQTVKITVTAFADKVLSGKVAQITPLATTSEAGDVSYPVLVTLDQSDPEVRPGMTARLEFAQ